MKRKGLWVLLILLVTGGGITALFFRPDIPLEILKKKYTFPDSDFITVDSIAVHYRQTGPSGQYPLLLLHGTGSSLHTWEGWTETLSSDFRIISLDLPAYGLTGPNRSGDYSIPEYVAFLDRFVQKIGVDSFFLAGNSLGGLIAWNYAASYPEKVKKLILIDAAGMPRTQRLPLAIRLAQNPLTSKILLKITPEFLFRKSLLDVYEDDEKVTDDLVRQYFELFLRPGNRKAFVTRARQKLETDTAPLQTLPMPVLIMWGKADTWIPLDDAFRFERLIPNSTTLIYDYAGHVPMEEIPEQTAADAKIFLEQ